MTAEKTAVKKHLSVTVYYLFAAIVFSWIGFFHLGVVLPFWQNGITATPQSLFVIHTIILGFMMTVAFGVFYQFIPIAFQAPAIGRHVLYWQLPIHCLAVAVLIFGFWQMQMQTVGYGGILLLCNGILYLSFVFRSYRKAKNQTFVHKGLIVPLLLVSLVMLFGIWMAFGLPGAGIHLLLIHVFLGAFGFWAGLVIVISYKFIPMFTLSHGYKISQKSTLLLYFSSVAVILVAEISTDVIQGQIGNILTVIGSLLGIVAFIRFTIDMYKIVRARKRKNIVLPIRYSLVSLGILVVTGILLMILIMLHTFVWLSAITYVMLYGGFVPLIFSYMQKIVPFLWFEYRFSQRPERKQAPLIDDMVSKIKTKWSMNLYFLGMVIGLVGFLTSSTIGEWFNPQIIKKILDPASGLICLFASMLLFNALVRVLTIGGPRPHD